MNRIFILNNLQNTNANMIEEKIPQKERLIKLNNIARKQMLLLKDNENINKLEKIQSEIEY